MMLANISSSTVVGLEAVPITVEVDIASQGLPSFTIGLPDKAVEESKERVRAAIKNSGAEFPAKRITVNLAPADLSKIGPAYDLPIALGILIASGQLPEFSQPALFIGELSLDGSLRHTNGILPLAMLVKNQKMPGGLFVPSSDAVEATVIGGINVYSVASLLTLFHHLTGNMSLTPFPHLSFADIPQAAGFEFDMADVVGQEQVKRALEIAAAGAHNLFMQGPPGAGKTMLARTLPSILPTLTEEEALEVTKIYSVTGNLPARESFIKFRSFRAPHHTTSRIGLIGGGTYPASGEISLAHRGVLFLDEFPEFPRHDLEALRQPIEDGVVTISRAVGTMRYPAAFMLLAAANPCPCGNFGSETKRCSCLPGMVTRYQKRVSGPIIDRIDLHVSVPAVRPEKFSGEMSKGESSKSIQSRVQRARANQLKRFTQTKRKANADMSTRDIKEFCPLSYEVSIFLRQAVSRMGLSAHSYYRVIKVSRTIADLANEKDIAVQYLAQALQYRPVKSI